MGKCNADICGNTWQNVGGDNFHFSVRIFRHHSLPLSSRQQVSPLLPWTHQEVSGHSSLKVEWVWL